MKETELITNSDGSIFHLKLLPGDIARKIVIVGDPGRVDMFATLLKDIRVKKENREFRTVTGTYDLGEITVISSGIGTDNIDIVMNELDALVNVDFATGKPKDELTSLDIVRIGTSGGLQQDIPAGSFVITETAIGFDGLIHFYEGYDWLLDTAVADVLVEHLEWPDTLSYPYAIRANKELMEVFRNENFIKGITVSVPGFYAPQGRKIRLETFDNEINEKLASYSFRGKTITNYEMESSAIYGLAGLLGHRAVTICTILGNRVTGEFIHDYKPLMIELARKVFSLL
ncbi:MAG TPA: nucleoside phosphorylase [Bacteroidales bacterium]|nr:nucleoside phosphorylase [Bacteroidales bacterium]